MEIRLYFYLAIGFNSISGELLLSYSGLSFTKKFRVAFCRTLLPMIDANCQRSAFSNCFGAKQPVQGVWKHCQFRKLDVNAFHIQTTAVSRWL